MAQWHYVWNEWFRTAIEVGYDPRCKVPYPTFEERLKTLPIQQAVLETPLDISSYSDPRVLELIKQGFDLDLACQVRSYFKREEGTCRLVQTYFHRLLGCDNAEELYFKYKTPYVYRATAWNAVSKEMKTKVSFTTWTKRVYRGWNIYSAFYQDFWNILNGKKYKSLSQARSDYPWIHPGFNGSL
jgi:hypothetical protein